LGGMRFIKVCGTEDAEKAAFKTEARKVYSTQYKGNRYVQLVTPVSEVFIFGLICASFLIAVNVRETDITKIFPVFAAYLVVLVKMLTQLNTLNNCRSTATQRMAAFTAYEHFCDARDKKTIIGGTRVPGAFSQAGEFNGVCFA
ncbi:MAG: hypothetical protein ABH885_01890, partial [Candidatus Omnitrophota bacterium]